MFIGFSNTKNNEKDIKRQRVKNLPDC